MTESNRVSRSEPFGQIYKQCSAGNSKYKLANLPTFPRYIDVEMTNTCNFRCLMCPTGTFAQKRSKGFMSEEVFSKILAEIKIHRTPVRFIRWGEPMMHPLILEFLRRAHENGSMTHMNSNGSYFNEENIQILCDGSLDSLKFSFQGVDRVSYGEMRNCDYFDQLVDVIKKFVEIRGKRPKPFIQVSTSITYETAAQVAQFKALMEALVDKVSVGHTLMEHLDIESVRLRPDEREKFIRLKEEQSLVREHPECPEVFDKISINWDGTVSACCGDYDNLMIIGDLKKNSIAEIWMSSEMQYYRQMLAEMRHDELSLCKTCFDEQGLSKTTNQNRL